MEEKTSFRLIFGDSPIIKVIDFLIDNQEFDYSLTEITRGADVGWTTLHQFWKDLINMNIVVKTRRISRAEMYKLNKDNPLVQKLIDLDLFISKQMIQKELEKQSITA